jgi:hypothetical protein
MVCLPAGTHWLRQRVPRLPRYHQVSPQPCMGDDLYAPYDQRGQ